MENNAQSNQNARNSFFNRAKRGLKGFKNTVAFESNKKRFIEEQNIDVNEFRLGIEAIEFTDSRYQIMRDKLIAEARKVLTADAANEVECYILHHHYEHKELEAAVQEIIDRMAQRNANFKEMSSCLISEKQEIEAVALIQDYEETVEACKQLLAGVALKPSEDMETEIKEVVNSIYEEIQQAILGEQKKL